MKRRKIENKVPALFSIKCGHFCPNCHRTWSHPQDMRVACRKPYAASCGTDKCPVYKRP